MRKFGGRKPLCELAEMLPEHTVRGVGAQCTRLGVAKDPAERWTDEEHEILREHGGRPVYELADMLPGRTAYAIALKRTKLGVANADERWTEEENETLREFGNQKLIHELAEMLPGRTALAVGNQRMRLGIELSPEYISRTAARSRARLDNDLLCKLDQSLAIDDFDSDTIQILLGSILGDGCIKKNGVSTRRNCIFYEGHGREQADYVRWKAKQLSAFLPKCAPNGRPEMWTVSHPLFTMLRSKFYRADGNRRKGLVPMDILSRLGMLGLMVWYLDDGYLGVNKNGTRGGKCRYVARPRPRITAKLFDYDGLVRLCAQLNDRLSLDLYVKRTKWKDGKCNVVRFRAEDFRRVIPVWRAYAKQLELPECMYYKLNMHDPRLRFIEGLDLRTREGRSRFRGFAGGGEGKCIRTSADYCE